MAFLKELERKKEHLRKVEAPKERNIPDKLLFENDDDCARLIRETSFENYYNLIEQFTFKSVIINLTREEIQALYDAYLDFEANKNEIPTKQNPVLDDIAVKVDEGIKNIREQTKNQSVRCFLRLSTKSPKDAIFHMKPFEALYTTKLKEFDDEEDISSKLIAFYRASTEILAISSGKEGVDMLTVSNRIQGDLKMSLEKPQTLSLERLIIREFVHFPVENELRGFVWKKHLTALSQYNSIAYLPNLARDKEVIEKKVKSCMEKFITLVGEKLENFTVDIVLDNDGKVWIVEINPLVDDRELLLNEDGRFEFRIHNTPPDIPYIKGEINEKLISFLKI